MLDLRLFRLESQGEYDPEKEVLIRHPKNKAWEINEIVEYYFQHWRDHRKRYVAFSNRITVNGTEYWFPIFDCDTPKTLAKALTHLRGHGMQYTFIESSPNHYWLIGPPAENASAALNTMNLLKFGDSRFVELSIERKLVVLRGLYRPPEHRPIIVEAVGYKDGVMQGFIQAIEEHFKDIRIKVLSELINTRPVGSSAQEIQQEFDKKIEALTPYVHSSRWDDI